VKKVIKNIFLILRKKEKTGLIKLVLFDVVISVLDIGFLAALLFVIRFYAEPGQANKLTYFPFNLFNRYPLLLIIVFFILYGIKNMAGYLVSRMQFRFVYEVASRLSANNLSAYLGGSYKDYVDIDSSVHNRKIAYHPVEFAHYVLGGVQQMAGQAVLILVTIVAILIFSPVLFSLLVLIIIPPVALAGFLVKRKLNTIRKTMKVTGERTLQHLQEALSGFVESNVYGRKDFFVKRYDASQSAFNYSISEQLAVQNMPSKLIEVFAIFGLFILVLINLYTTHTSVVQLITLGAFMAASYKIIPGIVKTLNVLGQVKTYEFTIHDLLQNKEPVTQTQQPAIAINTIEFENVSFTYRNEAVLNNLSFTINKGDFIGMSASSGKGKTTVINLLLGFLNPGSGNIFLNGSMAEAAERQQYWKTISYVKQEPFLFHDTILHNITMDENNYDEEKLRQVVDVAGLPGFLPAFPSGLRIIITENGKNISGGQRQRIAIARALYKEADLIILDEPFNELDEESEHIMLRHFKRLSENGKIIILVTHNKESLSFCDKVISMDDINADTAN
jgi:ABC-type multidrug transport system fused ATPase/permease subunit